MHKKRMILFFMSVSIGLMPIQAFAAETTDPIVSEATEDISDLSEFDETTVPDNLSSSFSAKSEFHYVYGCFRKNVFQYPVHGDYYRSDQSG